MEEPVFIKLEPEMLPDMEESSCIEPDMDMPTGKFEEIKVEPSLVFDGDSSGEEETSEIIKKEHQVKVWKDELNSENPAVIGNLSDNLQPCCFTSDEQIVKHFESSSRQKTKGRTSCSEVLERPNCSLSGKVSESEIFPSDNSTKNLRYLPPTSTISEAEASTYLGFKKGELFSCKICDKTFERIKYLKRHLIIHAEQKPHVCSICGRSFVRKEQLDCHLSTHRGVKLFTCKVCGKQFTQRSSLERHGVLHTGSKPYSCKLCLRTFGDLSNFRRHSFLHSGQKPYLCDTCGKSFPAPSAVARHAVTHAAIKCHRCDVCGRSFSTKGNLNRHKVIHAEDKPFSCSTCGRAYRALFMLRRHMVKHRPRATDTSISDKRTDDQSVITVSLTVHKGR
ncbi:zinc finger protein OZF [Anabrus simplex]|uniref:zinc finger protein OZF n=1 Tax=Anabrus simplex TaxID=316456 RepID=UPI0035A2CFDE